MVNVLNVGQTLSQIASELLASTTKQQLLQAPLVAMIKLFYLVAHAKIVQVDKSQITQELTVHALQVQLLPPQELVLQTLLVLLSHLVNPLITTRL